MSYIDARKTAPFGAIALYRAGSLLTDAAAAVSVLFERPSNSVHLNARGKAFLADIEPHIEALSSAVARVGETERMRIRIARTAGTIGRADTCERAFWPAWIAQHAASCRPRQAGHLSLYGWRSVADRHVRSQAVARKISWPTFSAESRTDTVR